MTRRLLHFFASCLLVTLLSALGIAPSAAHAEGIDINSASLQSTDEGYKLDLNVSFELNSGLEDAIMRGVPLYFTTDVEISRPRWYWFDEHAASTSRTIRVSYNVLTHQYHAAIIGHLQRSFNSLDDALSLVRRPSRWVVADRNALTRGETYNVAVRVELDVERLPKPFQVNALNNSDWRLSSDWKQFSYRAD